MFLAHESAREILLSMRRLMTEMSRHHHIMRVATKVTPQRKLVQHLLFASRTNLYLFKYPRPRPLAFEMVEVDRKPDSCWNYELGKRVHMYPGSIHQKRVPRPCYPYVEGGASNPKISNVSLDSSSSALYTTVF